MVYARRRHIRRIYHCAGDLFLVETIEYLEVIERVSNQIKNKQANDDVIEIKFHDINKKYHAYYYHVIDCEILVPRIKI